MQSHLLSYLPSNPSVVSDVIHSFLCTCAGVAEGMVGMKQGESREIQLTLPDNFEPAALRGCPVTCQVAVSELFEYNLAEVSAKTLSKKPHTRNLPLSYLKQDNVFRPTELHPLPSLSCRVISHCWETLAGLCGKPQTLMLQTCHIATASLTCMHRLRTLLHVCKREPCTNCSQLSSAK